MELHLCSLLDLGIHLMDGYILKDNFRNCLFKFFFSGKRGEIKSEVNKNEEKMDKRNKYKNEVKGGGAWQIKKKKQKGRSILK